jgi:DNA/RNA non-specific endonuclease
VWSIEGPIVHTDRTDEGDKGRDSGARGRFYTYLLKAVNAKVAGAPYNPGHLIAGTLGGPHDTRNLVPQRQITNQNPGGWFMMERWIRMCLDVPGTRGTMKVKPTYPKSDTKGLAKFVPDPINVEVTFVSAGGVTKTHAFSMNQNSTSFNAPTGCV